MPRFPYDVWLNVSLYIPRHELQRLLSVNSALFDIAMNARYYEVHLRRLDRDTTQKILHLSNPSVGKRVRALYIHAQFQQDVYKRDFYTSLISFKSTPPWRRKIQNVAKHLHGIRSHSRHPTPEDQRSERMTCGEINEAMIQALAQLCNVTEYNIDTGIFPLTPRFLRVAWQSMGPKLRNLKLVLPMYKFQAITSWSVLHAVEDLHLEFYYGVQTTTMYSAVGAFINSLSPTLRSLRIVMRERGSLDPMLHSLCHFPRLEQIELTGAFEIEYDHSPFILMLNKHAPTLKHLSLSLGIYPLRHTRGLSDVILPQLRSLELNYESSYVGERFTSNYIKPIADTLTSLTLRGPFFDFDAVDAIISEFSHRPPNTGLKTLRMHVHTLSPQLVDSLARNLHGLHTLDLVVKTISADTSSRSRLSFELPFFREMRKCQYDGWKLRDISIRNGSRFPATFEWKAMKLLGKCIPSIQSFCELGSMPSRAGLEATLHPTARTRSSFLSRLSLPAIR